MSFCLAALWVSCRWEHRQSPPLSRRPVSPFFPPLLFKRLKSTRFSCCHSFRWSFLSVFCTVHLSSVFISVLLVLLCPPEQMGWECKLDIIKYSIFSPLEAVKGLCHSRVVKRWQTLTSCGYGGEDNVLEDWKAKVNNKPVSVRFALGGKIELYNEKVAC